MKIDLFLSMEAKPSAWMGCIKSILLVNFSVGMNQRVVDGFLFY